MGRLVRKPLAPDLDLQIAGLESMLQSGIGAMPMVNAERGDDYLERMIKYVPGEVIAFSMIINAMLDQAIKSGGDDAAMAGVPVTSIAVGALIGGCVLTPLFCWYVREDGDAWILNSIVSTVAFPIWAYLMDAVAFANHHDGVLAVILVLTFTVVSGLISPRPRQPVPRELQDARDGPRLVESLTA